MTDEIKKMLEPSADFFDPQKVSRESFDRIKRGFLKLMEQRDWWRAIAVRHGYHGPNNENAELLKAMETVNG